MGFCARARVSRDRSATSYLNFAARLRLLRDHVRDLRAQVADLTLEFGPWQVMHVSSVAATPP